jgi:hypothetical protein
MKKNTNKTAAVKASPAKKAAKDTLAIISAAVNPAPAVKPLVDLSKLKTSALQKALNQGTSMKPAIAAAYRAELESRMAAEYKAAPASQPPAAAKPAAAKAAPAPAPAKDTLAIHVNKTGRVCFAKDAAARLAAFFGESQSRYCLLAIDGGIVRLEPSKKQADGALPVRDASGRPYVSATKQFKPLGFDGSRPYDIEAKPYGAAGFEFRLA